MDVELILDQLLHLQDPNGSGPVVNARVEERSGCVKQRRFFNIQPAMTLRRHQFAFHPYPSFARR